ncbi:MAG: DUF5063 domain-containing protein [Porphyromonas sp.]|nr:DUF5063 domain-containing protein [Porphyromonas sp.]
MNNPNQTVFGNETIEFARVGVEFASLMEKAKQLGKREFVDQSVKLLPLLYLRTHLLPSYEYDSQVDYAPTFVNEDMYDEVRIAVTKLLGEDDGFLTTLHQDMQYSDTPIGASLGECLADVYQQIVDLLGNIREAEEYNTSVAIGRARLYFFDYWGERLLAALGALHALIPSLSVDEDGTQKDDELSL